MIFTLVKFYVKKLVTLNRWNVKFVQKKLFMVKFLLEEIGFNVLIVITNFA